MSRSTLVWNFDKPRLDFANALQIDSKTSVPPMQNTQNSRPITSRYSGSTYGTNAPVKSASVHTPPARAALPGGSETHLTGGVSAESSSSGREERGDEVAGSGWPGTRLRGNLVPGLHPADASGATVRSRCSRTFQDAPGDLGASTCSFDVRE